MPMKRQLVYGVLAALLSACGGGGGEHAVSSTPAAPVTTRSAAGQPNAHGLLAGADGVYPTDAQAGIFANANGLARSYSAAGTIDTTGPFFKSFGNGRTCASCHRQENGFSISAKGVQEVFTRTGGTDPLFLPHDGANSPRAPMATPQDRQAAYSLLLNRGVFRIGMHIPESAEFELITADDPYQFANIRELSLFRRPLPSANLSSIADVMWDGRENALDANSANCVQATCFAAPDTSLARQATTANNSHAQAQADLSKSDVAAIVSFEKTLFAAQQVDTTAGLLFAADHTGGATALSAVQFSFGANSIFRAIAAGDTKLFNQNVFTLFSTWINDASSSDTQAVAARQSIARGQTIFNTRAFNVSKDVPGTEGLGLRFLTCSTCHSGPNVGSLSEPRYFNIGTADAQARTADMPLYTLRNIKTGEQVQTQDPGRAMVSGLWKDIGRFKTPGLRGLSMRAPYFHDGSASTTADAIAFYDKKFNIQFTPQELVDLDAFLKAL
jgi:cytochrome c peroxidase